MKVGVSEGKWEKGGKEGERKGVSEGETERGRGRRAEGRGTRREN